ncbi:TolC family protein [Chitinophaga sp. XS-30]|nr:TolC family protein [Chitinophaga sp. XS-30]
MFIMLSRIIILLVFTNITLYSQAQPSQLDGYIQEAFARNQAIRRQHFQLDKSMYALKEARAFFLPQAGFAASYTKAGGGRTIDIPIGDLMNPVYSTLNELTNSHQFPQLDNQAIQLTPDNFYDARLRTSLPLINTEIWYAKKIRQEDITRQQAVLNVYKRQLVKDVKTAYYQYYQASQAVEIYIAALELVQENIRVNNSMLKNGIRNSTSLTRAQAEAERTDALLTQARNGQKNAKAWFNFLLNRPAEDSIQTDNLAIGDPQMVTPTDIRYREELVQLEKTRNMAMLQQKMQHAAFVPKVNTFLDLGSQGFNFAFNNNTRYYIWGLNLQWDLFTGGQRRYRTLQAAADVSMAQTAYDEHMQAMMLELTRAVNDHHTARAAFSSARTQLQLSEKYYRDQLKVYKEGQLLYIELLDAQNQLTNARLQLAQAYAAAQVSAAEVERAQAGYPLANTR